MKLGLRSWLSLSMAGLALFTALLSTAIYTGFAVRAIVDASVRRAQTVADEAALLASRAASGPVTDAGSGVANDPLLAGHFRSALATDPTLIDMGVYDASGRALRHSHPERSEEASAPRPPLADLTEGDVVAQAVRVLGPGRTYEHVVPLQAGERRFGEVRVGVSTVLLRAQLLEGLQTGLWGVLAALVLALVLAIAFAQLLSRRVRDAVAGLERLSEGEFGYRLHVEGRDELALLAASINALGERMERARQRAAEERAAPAELLAATDHMTEWAKVASGMAHEIADPLNAAALHLGRLKRKWTNPTPEAERHLQVLESELKRLEQVLVGFRRFAMLGRMQAEAFDPGQLIADIAERAEESLRERRTTIRVERENLPERFLGDPALIRRAVSNLISNAEEAMPGGGGILLAARGLDGGLEIEVRDEGQGIPPELLARVFEFHFTTRAEGTGIGLAVVQQVARMHGGTAHIESKPGEGTRVVMRLPLKSLEPLEVG